MSFLQSLESPYRKHLRTAGANEAGVFAASFRPNSKWKVNWQLAINPDAVGATTGPFSSSWSADDCMLYALGVGACLDDPMSRELKYVTENNSATPLRALPTMCTVLGGVLGAPSPLDDIGNYDKRMSVHGTVELVLHRPLPTQGSLVSTVAVDGIYDKKRGALVSMTIEACEAENGLALFEVRNGIFVRGEGGWGGNGGPPWPRRFPTIGHQTPRLYKPLGLTSLCFIASMATAIRCTRTQRSQRVPDSPARSCMGCALWVRWTSPPARSVRR